MGGATLEFGNSIYAEQADAATAFMGMFKSITKDNDSDIDITIEEVMAALDAGEESGIFGGYPQLFVVINRCSGGCVSPSWN